MFLTFSDCVLSLGLCSQSCHVMQYLADFKIREQDIVGIVDLRAVSLVLRAVSLFPIAGSFTCVAGRPYGQQCLVV